MPSRLQRFHHSGQTHFITFSCWHRRPNFTDAATPPGPAWDDYYSDIAIYSADGTVTPIYYRQNSIGLSYFSGGNISNPQASVQVSNSAGDAELPANTTTYYLSDQIGSARMLVAAGGWPVSSDIYYPFGQEQSAPADNNHYKFTGKERDSETGFDYFGARYYGSVTGRFLSPDPSQLYYADPTNPQSFNLYGYGWNNPLTNIDPSGMDACAYDNGNGTATIKNAADGGAVDCPGNGFYITTSKQVTAVGFNGNGDLSIYGAGGNLYNPDGSSYVASQTVTVGANGSDSFIPTQAISSPGIQYLVSMPAQLDGLNYQMADVCGASALLNNGLNTGLDTLGAVPVLGSWSDGVKTAVNSAQLAGGVVSAGMATNGTVKEAVAAGAGLGLTGASKSVPAETMRFAGDSVEIIPFVGNLFSGGMALNDMREMNNYYNDCMAEKN